MPCSKSTPPELPYSAYLAAVTQFQALDPADPIRAAYDTLRDLLFEVVTGADDPRGYQISWKTLDTFGKADLEQFEATGSMVALDRLKSKVKLSSECLP